MAAEPIGTIDDDAAASGGGSRASLGCSGQEVELAAVSDAVTQLISDVAALRDTLAALERVSDQLDRTERKRLIATLTSLLGTQDLLASLVTQAVGLVESTGAWREEPAGARNFSDWLGRVTRHGTGGGRRIQEKARTLEVLPAVKEAATTPGSGMSDAHVAQVARALESSPPDTRKRVVEAQEEILLLARAKDAVSFGRDLRARIAALEADAADASFEEAHQNRFLRLSPWNGSVKVEGMLDPVAGETVRRALEAVTAAPSGDDPRTSQQRSADALTLLAGRALSYGEKKGSLNRPHVTVLMREETFVAARARQQMQAEVSQRGWPEGGRTVGDGAVPTNGVGGQNTDKGVSTTDRGAGDTSAGRPGADDASLSGAGVRRAGTSGLSGDAFRRSGLAAEPPLAQLEDGTALPPAAVEALLCDAEVQRLVLDSAGQPLDVGLATRSFTTDLRIAILRRDRHCQFPWCTLRASWCEIHHRRYWSDGGATSLENGITLCSFHHHRVHAESIGIRAVPDGFVFTTRDGRLIGRTTRLHDQILVPRPWPSTDPPTGETPAERTAASEKEPDRRRPRARCVHPPPGRTIESCAPADPGGGNQCELEPPDRWEG